MTTKKLILIDFDGTITLKDSFIEFIKFNKSTSLFYSTIWFTYLIFLIHKIGLYNARKAKEYILSFYFKGKNTDELNQMAKHFIDYLFQKKGFRSELLQHIKIEKENNSRIIIVSASPDLWIAPFCHRYNIELIASELKYENNIFNGKFASPNCNGKEKAIRIKSIIDLSTYDEIEVHGNSKGDIPMMELGTKNFWY